MESLQDQVESSHVPPHNLCRGRLIGSFHVRMQAGSNCCK